jgi:hypothetical protein
MRNQCVVDRAPPRVGKRKVMLLGLAVLVAACGAEGDSDEPIQGEDAPVTETLSLSLGRGTIRLGKAKVVANVTLANREVIFLETESGGIAEIDHGRLDPTALPPVEPQGLDSVQRYAFLAGAEAPPGLKQAQERLHAKMGPQVHGSLEQDEIPDATPAKVPGQKGVTGPADAESRDWFRATYCVRTDRTHFVFSGQVADLWQRNGINYMRSGIYSRWANQTPIHAYISYQSFWQGVSDVSVKLDPNEYVALRESTIGQAEVISQVREVDSGDIYDHCVNFHH